MSYLGMMFITYLVHGDLINNEFYFWWILQIGTLLIIHLIWGLALLINKKKDTNKKLNTYKKIRDIELNNHTHKSKYIKRKVLIKN